jgi:hypothetical protein
MALVVDRSKRRLANHRAAGLARPMINNKRGVFVHPPTDRMTDRFFDFFWNLSYGLHCSTHAEWGMGVIHDAPHRSSTHQGGYDEGRNW